MKNLAKALEELCKKLDPETSAITETMTTEFIGGAIEITCVPPKQPILSQVRIFSDTSLNIISKIAKKHGPLTWYVDLNTGKIRIY